MGLPGFTGELAPLVGDEARGHPESGNPVEAEGVGVGHGLNVGEGITSCHLLVLSTMASSYPTYWNPFLDVVEGTTRSMWTWKNRC